MQERLDREQPGEQRYKNHTNNGYTSASHELFYPQIGVLGAMVLAERTIGLTGVNLLRVLGVGGADGQ